MKVRPAELSDAPALAAIEAVGAHHPWSAEALRSSLAAPTTRGFVVGAPPIGHLLSSAVADEGEVLTLCVHPDHRRRGHARRLLLACQQAWTDSGVGLGWLEVRSDNAQAVALYRSAGWVEAGRRARYYADGQDALVMRWEVP